VWETYVSTCLRSVSILKRLEVKYDSLHICYPFSPTDHLINLYNYGHNMLFAECYYR
jgi:hypothetical protein